MKSPEHAIGQAIFVRTDVPDFSEVTVPFQTLGELVAVCSEGRAGMLLDQVIIYATVGDDPRSVALRFMSAGKEVEGGGPGRSQSRRPDARPGK